MKIFKFIRKLFSNLHQHLKENLYYEEGASFLFAIGLGGLFIFILGVIADFLGVPLGKADHVMEKGAIAFIALVVMSVIGAGLYALFNLIVILFRYLKKVWKEL